MNNDYLKSMEWVARDCRRRGILYGMEQIRLSVNNCHPESYIQTIELIDDLVRLMTNAFKGIDQFENDENNRINYKEYIKSPEWKEKSIASKEKAGMRCQLCNNAGDNHTLHTHHRTYERLGDELPEDLIVLCAACHAKFHDKEL